MTTVRQTATVVESLLRDLSAIVEQMREEVPANLPRKAGATMLAANVGGNQAGPLEREIMAYRYYALEAIGETQRNLRGIIDALEQVAKEITRARGYSAPIEWEKVS